MVTNAANAKKGMLVAFAVRPAASAELCGCWWGPAGKVLSSQLQRSQPELHSCTAGADAAHGLQGVGCTTPGSRMLIEEREVRGVPSSGMLCSAWDLGWVPEPDGVLVELPLDLMPGDLCPTDAPADVRPLPLAAPGCPPAQAARLLAPQTWPEEESGQGNVRAPLAQGLLADQQA